MWIQAPTHKVFGRLRLRCFRGASQQTLFQSSPLSLRASHRPGNPQPNKKQKPGKVLKKKQGKRKHQQKENGPKKTGAQNFLNLFFLLHSKTHPRFFLKKKDETTKQQGYTHTKKTNVWNLKKKKNNKPTPFHKKKR